MLTLGALIDGSTKVQCIADQPQCRSSRVTGVWPADELLGSPDHHSLPAGLLMISAADAPWWQEREACGQAIRTLVERDTVALLLKPVPSRPGCTVEEPMPSLVAEAARAAGLPLLCLEPESTPDHLVRAIETAQSERAEKHVEFLTGLLEELRVNRASSLKDMARVLTSTAEVVHGHAAVVDPSGPNDGIASSFGPVMRNLLQNERCKEMVETIRMGRTTAAVLGEEDFRVHFLGIGNQVPRSVLAAARKGSFEHWHTQLLKYTATVLSVRESLSEAEASQRRMTKVMRQSRQWAFEQLMAGHVEHARNSVETLMPGLLHTDYVQVLLLQHPRSAGTITLRSCEAALEGLAMVVLRPGKDHVLVVAPCERRQGNARVQRLLQEMLTTEHYALGISTPVQLRQTRDGVEQATHALAVASCLPDRSAVHNGPNQLAHLLGPEAPHWGRDFLMPAHLTDDQRAELQASLPYVRDCLQYGPVVAARANDRDRKTIADRWHRCEALLGLDLRRLEDRTLLDLAMQLAQRPATGYGLMDVAPLETLLETGPAVTWAREQLAPLSVDVRRGQPLLETLRVWIAHNGYAKACAATHGLHANSVRKRLTKCEQLLGRSLLAQGSSSFTRSSAHDLVIALAILKDDATTLVQRAAELRSRAACRT